MIVDKCVYSLSVFHFFLRFGDEGCTGICKGLIGNRTIISLSMNYCDLGIASGTTLGKMVAVTAVR